MTQVNVAGGKVWLGADGQKGSLPKGTQKER
jgi:hypothetical protein